MSECCGTNCSAQATHYLKAKIAPTNFPIERGMDVILSLAICRRCAESATPNDIFTDVCKEQLQQALQATRPGAVKLDFDRVEIVATPFDDEWLAFLACAHGKLQ